MDDAPRAQKGPECVDAQQGAADLLMFVSKVGGEELPVKAELNPDADGGGATSAPGFPLGVVSISAHFEQALIAVNDLHKERIRVDFYPSGCQMDVAFDYSQKPPTVHERGDVTGFSKHSSRRLKEVFLTAHVPGHVLWKITLTTRANNSARIWRAIVARFRMACFRRGWPMLWRVELQRRQAPHLHNAAWLPPGCTLQAVEAVWLECARETKDCMSQRYAVVGEQISQDESGWAVYMALHDTKNKRAQSGWQGRQWGIWCGRLFVKRQPVTRWLGLRETSAMLRVLRNLEVSIRYAKERQKDLSIIRAMADDPVLAAMSLSLHSIVRKQKPRRMHRGNLLWLGDGEQQKGIADAILEGRIYNL